MSLVKVSGNASGTGTLTIAAPNTNSDYTLTLPTATTTLVGTDATQTLINKTIQGGAITSGTAVASTSGTSIDFTGLPSWVKRITVMFQGVSVSGTSSTLIQLGTGSTTYITTGYVGGGAIFSNVGVAGATFTTGFCFNNATAAASLSGNITISNISGNTWVASGTCGANSTIFACITGGNIALAAALTAVRITTINGTDTFDAGSINILYE